MLIKNMLSLCSVIALVLLGGCGTQEKEHKELTSSAIVLVNVLDSKLFNDARIKGSINVQLNELEAASKKWNKDATIVIYCSNYMCTASGQAARELQKMGFKDVRVYEGGTAEWYQMSKKDSSFELDGPQQQAYLTIELEKPASENHEIKEISAAELKKLLKEAKILS